MVRATGMDWDLLCWQLQPKDREMKMSFTHDGEGMPDVPAGEMWEAWDGNSYLVAADGITLIDGEGVHRSPFDLEPLPPSIVEMELKYGVLPAWVSDKLAAQS